MTRIRRGAVAILIAAAPSLSAQDAGIDTSRLAWRASAAQGIDWTETTVQGEGPARHSRLILVRVDPTRARFALVERRAAGGAAPGWTIRESSPEAIVALNAGQFTGSSPWGWVVRGGVERLAPARGPLSSTFAVTRDGALLWVDGDSLDIIRARRDLALAFQSYPALLVGDGASPRLFSRVSATQRDARLAIGIDRRGSLLIALTRFDGLGASLGAIPYGLTTPEMQQVMRALGARQAMLLDGGISAQLLVRTPGETERWSGFRRVPLALEVFAREHVR